MRRAEEFRQAIRGGFRVGNDLLVVHYLTDQSEQSFPLVGFIVPKRALPRAIDRNRVKRQLRSLITQRLSTLDPHSKSVIRVSKSIKGKTAFEIGSALDNAFQRVKRKAKNR